MTCPSRVQEEGCDARWQQRGRAAAAIKGGESSLHPNHWVPHTPAYTHTANFRWNKQRKSPIKGKWLHVQVWVLLARDMSQPHSAAPSSLFQMQRCFGIFCVSLIFCAALSETIGLVIAVRNLPLQIKEEAHDTNVTGRALIMSVEKNSVLWGHFPLDLWPDK